MRVVNLSWKLFLAAAFLSLGIQARACLWDSSTLSAELKRHPRLAEVVLGEPAHAEEPGPLRERITKLLANRREDDPEWLNDLAGAHIRLGELKEAVQLLEPGVKKFPNDYGVHANLGTAYHLQGRYAEAEGKIARDLEINPEAHFGLEKYHLALLQYLIRDEGYRSRHLYVDEFTPAFLHFQPYRLALDSRSAVESVNAEDSADLAGLEREYKEMVKTNAPLSELALCLKDITIHELSPDYRKRWDLRSDKQLEEGVIYMATLNPKEPACFQMLGVLCMKKYDQNLAVAAYEKAIALGSPQTLMLKAQVGGLKAFIRESQFHKFSRWAFFGLLLLIPLLIVYFLISKILKWRRKRVAASAPTL